MKQIFPKLDFIQAMRKIARAEMSISWPGLLTKHTAQQSADWMIPRD